MFNFTYAPGTTLQQMLGFEMAGRIWDAYLNDNVTINIYAGVASSSSLPDKVIGGALPGIRANESYTGLYNRLKSDAKSADDTTAVNGLNWLNDQVWFDKFVNGFNQGSVLNNGIVNLTRANAKALGYSFTDANALDGYIMFSDLAGAPVTWDYNYMRNGASDGKKLDFLSTAVHEIGHVLGFVSGIDRPGWLYNSFGLFTDPFTSISFNNSLEARSDMTTPLDLFRYSNTSRTAQFLNPVRDMSYGSWNGDKYFSIDKGKTALGYFSTGTDTSLGGDGQQASHWKSGGLLAPTLAAGARPWLTSLDLRALDVIGWDVNLNPSINLATLFGQAVGSLASRAGQNTTAILSSLGTSLSNLVSNRNSDVNTMLTNSQVYNWGNQGGDGAWQKILALMSLQGAFSSLDELGSAVTVQPNEVAGTVLNRVDLKALLESQGQQPTVPLRSTVSISVEQVPSIAPIQSDFSWASSSTPALMLPGQELDAGKIWQMGEKKSLNIRIDADPTPKTDKKPSLLSSAIDE